MYNVRGGHRWVPPYTRTSLRGSQRQVFLHDISQTRSHAIGLGLRCGLDHDTDQRFGTRGAEQDATSIAQYGLGSGNRFLNGRVGVRT